MDFVFQGSDYYTLGLEIEMQIVDSKTYNLVPRSDLLLDLCEKNGIDRVKPEIHQSQIEIDTEISRNVKECEYYIKNRIAQLYPLLDTLGLGLCAMGTHPFQCWQDRLISENQRYQELYHKYQWLIRRMNVYGMHVHVGIPSGEDALRVCHFAKRYLPHLLALSANSPFWQGIDTGMQSTRVNIMESFPNAGLPPSFKDWSDFQYYIETLYRVKAIGSLKDLYWFIRPNLQFGTVEFRMCDVMSTLEETISVTALIQCLVAWIHRGQENFEWSVEQQWIAPENQWLAARDGLDAEIIIDTKGGRKKIKDELIDLVNKKLYPIAIQLNCEKELLGILNVIENGNGAERQRAIFENTRSLKSVVAGFMQEMHQSIMINV